MANGRSSKFREGSRVRQTPEEGRRIYRPKRYGNNNKDEDNSPKNLNDKNQQASSQKFRQLRKFISNGSCSAFKSTGRVKQFKTCQRTHYHYTTNHSEYSPLLNIHWSRDIHAANEHALPKLLTHFRDDHHSTDFQIIHTFQTINIQLFKR